MGSSTMKILVNGPNVYYLDSDGDGFGNAELMGTCGQPEQYVDNDTDDDLNTAINPSAEEVCDEIDNTSDGAIDDADLAIQYSPENDWYADLDMDGFGDPLNVTQSCVVPPGTTNNAEDCDDINSDINPSVTRFVMV